MFPGFIFPKNANLILYWLKLNIIFEFFVVTHIFFDKEKANVFQNTYANHCTVYNNIILVSETSSIINKGCFYEEPNSEWIQYLDIQ